MNELPPVILHGRSEDVQQLFRAEASERRGDSLQGNVHLALPVSWHLLGLGMLGLLATLAIFLAQGSFARVQVVQGQIEPHSGSLPITPSRPGVISNLKVEEGSVVAAGALLAIIRAEESDPDGGSSSVNVLSALGEQDAYLAEQQRLILAGAESARDRLLAEKRGIAAELIELDAQITAQSQLLQNAVSDLGRVQEVAQRGYVSRRDVAVREDLVTTRKQQHAALLQARAAKSAELFALEKSVAERASQASAEAANIAGSRTSVAQQRLNVSAARGYALIAPMSGTITSLTAKIGQPAQVTEPIMTIVPSTAKMEAKLYVPTRAAGFLRRGQEVRLQIDAFPYATFGTVSGRIERISTSATPRKTNQGNTEPVYQVVATIPQPHVQAFGRVHKLQPDMTLTARIVLERRSLGAWLFEPFFAVRDR